MRVKRYVVDSMPEALGRIRTDLGKDAVILNTKEIRSGGFLGLFGKKKIEVIAATDSNAPAVAPGAPAKPSAASVMAAAFGGAAAPAPAPAPVGVPLSTAANAYGRSDTHPVFVGGSAPVAAALAVAEEEALPPIPVVNAAPPVAVQLPAVHRPEQAPAQPQPSSQAAGLSGVGSTRARPKEDQLLEEIKQMKEMMARLSGKIGDEPRYPEAIGRFRTRLLDQEIEEDLVDRILRLAAEQFTAPESPGTDVYAEETVRAQLKDLLTASAPKAIAPDTRIAHFVGPTGVGKTTTIAKLAAEQVLKYNRKVGFITSDTYRIAAVEQLKTYATILNVPLEVVFSPQELVKAFQQLQDCELIFMDTAGRNFRNPMYVSELNSLLQARGKSETFLVLSLTSKYKDMKAITDNFAKFRLDKVLFTKMDETRSYGSILNLLYDFPIQLSYITNGQNVPDDIMEANEEQLINRILEEASP
ncbi:flagellar biosynthesis protein FlhF [Paenibacillus sp. HJGM_3]|uniref:flagellar biosynthesis protein FlhF n=1 Tax=Paenibacillus sp. HJGM_3 TaxID=3379816 RepID=UPI003858E57C